MSHVIVRHFLGKCSYNFFLLNFTDAAGVDEINPVATPSGNAPTVVHWKEGNVDDAGDFVDDHDVCVPAFPYFLPDTSGVPDSPEGHHVIGVAIHASSGLPKMDLQ